MKAYLVRHGIAEENHPVADAERALTPKGRVKMAQEAKGLGKIDARPEVILTSPLRRAMETAAIISQGLGGIRVEQMRELGQTPYRPAEILEAIGQFGQFKEIALVGHQPGMGQLAAFMLTGSTDGCDVDFKKGAVMCLEGLSEDVKGRYMLVWSLPPRVLRSL